MKHIKRSPGFPLMPNESEYCLVGDNKKRKYPTKLDAELFAPSRNVTQYICDNCGKWHNATPSDTN